MLQVCKSWEKAVCASLTELCPARVDPAFWQKLPKLQRLDCTSLYLYQVGMEACKQWLPVSMA